MTCGSSQRVFSAQGDAHARLKRQVWRHLQRPSRRPVAAHTRAAFESLRERIGADDALILDAGCGNAESAIRLSRRHPHARVIGIDKSAARIGAGKHAPLPQNLELVRAELGDFWRLAVAADWRLDCHYLLYPNPWPKPGHLQRRWHGHSGFPALLALGGAIELRTNWRIYAHEFARALHVAGVEAVQCGPLVSSPESSLSPFERKYAASGHTLWRVCAHVAEPLRRTLRAALNRGGAA